MIWIINLAVKLVLFIEIVILGYSLGYSFFDLFLD